MQKVCVIIPTYNERETIALSLDSLQREFAKIHDFAMEILVFDSNSPDGTADIVRQKQQQYPNIHLLVEAEKSGLGSAYIKAMQYCSAHLGSDIVFEFDSDGSHQPRHIPEMLKHFHEGADVVMGSRYVPGGSIPKDWAWNRKLLSTLGNRLAQIILNSKIKDYTTGFRATRVNWLNKISLNNLLSRNYAYKIHLIWELFLAGAKIVEHPIEFIDREKGHSKFPKNNMVESLALILRLRARRLKRYAKVCITGGIGAAIQFLAFNLLRHSLHPVYANLISAELAIINNFTINNFFSFREHRLGKQHRYSQWLKKFLLFNSFSLGSLFLQGFVMFLGVDLLGDGLWRENFYMLTGVFLASIYNFKMYAYFIWKKAQS